MWTSGRIAHILLLCSPIFALSAERFDETLSINTLQDGKVSSKFTFTTLLKGASPRNPKTLDEEDESQLYTVFPLGLGQILREYAVTELHLSLNTGRWNYDRWGYPEETGVGTGAELWAWMGDGAIRTVDERWKGLRNALAGLFCTSLGSMDDLRTTSPEKTFVPEGSLPNWDAPHQIRHASLPSENVCTENLTPFLKLLPCKSLSGIATLLNPHKLFDADWHGMSVHVLWRGDEGVEVRLTFQSVSDPLRSAVTRKQDWSFESLFGRTIDRPCPVAETSEVSVTLPINAMYTIQPEPARVENNLAKFDVKEISEPLLVRMIWPRPFSYPQTYHSEATPFSVRRTLKGSSQAWGQLSLVIENHRPTSMRAMYLETMPWLLQFHLHTLQARIDGVLQDKIISNVQYMPSVPHSRPTTLQAILTLPPDTSVHITMDVTKAFLRYTEFQPDAQRGWDLPPAIITPLEDHDNYTIPSYSEKRMYTANLLVEQATPDFSMPYNVIIFTCSLIAFIFGSIFNILTRNFVLVKVD
ncbi:GPI transamidase component GPI16 [Crepidotus variabilis]|uniref:GPI transamidase component GPI16 n=1 Tax=Crepidotus variabilis TaxID=179855 RepID=A0A9P6E7K5_9AGAR|nr:GPI transamidase component GPI16 [Crepidotus variabilis]